MKLNTTLKDRCAIYAEVSVVSFIWFGSLLLISRWLPDSVNDWKAAIALAPILLLPYLVIACVAWEVKIGIMGTRADAVKKPPAKDARQKRQPEKKQ